MKHNAFMVFGESLTPEEYESLFRDIENIPRSFTPLVKLQRIRCFHLICYQKYTIAELVQKFPLLSRCEIEMIPSDSRQWD